MGGDEKMLNLEVFNKYYIYEITFNNNAKYGSCSV